MHCKKLVNIVIIHSPASKFRKWPMEKKESSLPGLTVKTAVIL